jgi:pilus assembly protein CpaE
MNNKLTSVIVGRNVDTARSIEAMLANINWLKVGTHLSSNGHADLVKGLHELPDILIVDLSDLWKEELQALDNISEEEKPNIIVIGREENTEVMRSAMKVGAYDYLTHPLDTSRLNESLNAISSKTTRKKNEDAARLITIINGKGGSGSTMLASNLSYILAKKFDKKVALYDFHLDITSLPLYFDIDVNSSFSDTMADLEHLDEIGLKGSMVQYDDNLYILTSKRNKIRRATTIGGLSCKKLLKLSSRTFDYIVADIPFSMNEDMSVMLKYSDEVYIVTQQSIPHLNETSLIYKQIIKSGVPKDSITIIINRYKANDAVRIDEFEQSLGNNLITIPSDYKAVNYSLNVGKPIYECAKRSSVSQSLIEIANSLTGTNEKNIFGRITRPISTMFR